MNVDPNDLDGDGLPNDYEDLFGLNKNDPSDAHTDLDEDGLDNTAEFKLGTIPNRADTDGDGVEDGLEVIAGYDPLNCDETFVWSDISVDVELEKVFLTLDNTNPGNTYSLLIFNFETRQFELVQGQQNRPGNGGALVFEDGFESGDTSVWSTSVP